MVPQAAICTPVGSLYPSARQLLAILLTASFVLLASAC